MATSSVAPPGHGHAAAAPSRQVQPFQMPRATSSHCARRIGAERMLGRTVEPEVARGILERLEFGVTEPRPRIFSVTVPGWRATKDVAIKDDLVEEVGRMVGYDSITPRSPLIPSSVPPGNPERKFQHEVRDVFVDEGFTEVYNYSFISEESRARSASICRRMSVWPTPLLPTRR